MFNKIITFAKALFLGHTDTAQNCKPRSAYEMQWKNVKSVWSNKKQNDFGIERLLRLFLVLTSFLFPIMLIRELCGRKSLKARKLGVEIYSISKIVLLVALIGFNLTTWKITLIIAVYFLIDIMHYLVSLVILTDVYTSPISYARSLIMIFVNYIEIVLEYAIIYLYSYSNYGIFEEAGLSKTSIIYFSFVTSATVGYGDITIGKDLGRIIVITQIFVFIIFIAVFVNYFASHLKDKTYYNKPGK